jgi:hypothetical protein
METLTLVWINTLVLACLAFPTLYCVVVALRDVRGIGRESQAHIEVLRGILAEQRALAQVLRELNESLKR